MWKYQIRRKDREEKRTSELESVLEFAQRYGRLPHTSAVSSAEEGLGRIYDYRKMMRRKGKTCQQENEILEKLEAYSRPRRNLDSRRRIIYSQRIREILDYCARSGSLPKLRSADKYERSIARRYFRLCGLTDRFTSEETILFEKLLPFRSLSSMGAAAKLQECQDFHKRFGRLPSSSSVDQREKQLGGFLFRFRAKAALGAELGELSPVWSAIQEILPEKVAREKALLEYVSKYHAAPKHTSGLKHERQLARYFSNLKSKVKSGRSSPAGHAFVLRIEEIIGRNDPGIRISEIMDFITQNRRRPKLNADNTIERRLAIRLGNLNQANRIGKVPPNLRKEVNSVIQLASQIQNMP
jgi:hypothetical protein